MFLFYFLAFLTYFFPISPNQTCQRILNIFVVLYYTEYRFYQRIVENSRILIKKNRDIVKTKHFQNSIVYYLLFNFLVFFTSFFSVLPVDGFQKILKIFVFFYCIDLRFPQKFLQNYGFFLKKIEIFEIQNFNKIPSFTISFLFFLAFLTFFFYFTYPNLSNNYGIFCCFLFEGLEILSTNSWNF